MVDSIVRCDGESSGKHRRLCANSCLIDPMPDGQDDLDASRLAGGQAVKFGLRPMLLKEAGTDDGDAKTRSGKTPFDGLAQTIANGQFEAIKPNAESLCM